MSTEGSKTPVNSLFDDIKLNKVVEFDGCFILEEITSNLEKHLKEESDNIDATDGIFDAITEFGETVTGKFEYLVEGDDDKIFFLNYCQKYPLYY